MESRYLKGTYFFALGMAVGSVIGLLIAYLSLARLTKDPVTWLIQTLKQLLGREDRLRLDLLLQ